MQNKTGAGSLERRTRVYVKAARPFDRVGRLVEDLCESQATAACADQARRRTAWK